MNLRSVNLNLLTVFDTMMSERNATRAGAVLGLSQPAISNSIAQLRVLLDDRLFIRVKNEMIPTARAHALADPIHEALCQVQTALACCKRFDASRATCSFRVGMSDYAAFVLLDPFAKQVHRRANHVKLRVSSFDDASLQPALDRGEIDLAIGFLDAMGTHARSAVLFEDEWVCIRAASKARSPFTLREYLAASHAVLGSRTTDEVDQALREADQRRNNVMSLPFSVSAVTLIESSDIVVTLPRRLAHALVRGRSVEVRDVPFPIRPVRVACAWHSRLQRDEANIWLRDLVMSLGLDEPIMQVA